MAGFVDDSQIIPILSAGDYNLTRKNFTNAIIQNKMILVGFSSYSCLKVPHSSLPPIDVYCQCIKIESEYLKIADALKPLNIPFARANVDKLKSISLQHGAQHLPSLVLYVKSRPLTYLGVQAVDQVIGFVKKQIDPPVKKLSSVEEVLAFLSSRTDKKNSISTVMVVWTSSINTCIDVE